MLCHTSQCAWTAENVNNTLRTLGDFASKHLPLSKIGCIHSPLVHVTSAKSPQITTFLDTNEVLGNVKPRICRIGMQKKCFIFNQDIVRGDGLTVPELGESPEMLDHT